MLRKWKTTSVCFLLAVCAQLQAQPSSLVSLGLTLYRVNGDGAGALETFANQPGTVIAMTLVPAGVAVTGCVDGDVLGIENVAGGRVWRIDGARAGTLSLAPIGNLPSGVSPSSIAFAHGRLYGIDGDANFFEIDRSTFQIGPVTDLFPTDVTAVGGLAFDGVSTWYITNGISNKLVHLADPPTATGWMPYTQPVGIDFDNSGLEMYRSQLWGALRGQGGNLWVGTFNLQTGVFSSVWNANSAAASLNVGFVTFTPECLDVTDQPAPQTVCPGDAAAFTVTAAFWSGSNLTYQWQIEAVPVGSNNWSDLPGGPINGSAATASGTASASLTIANAQFAAARRYRCRVSNSCGTTFSIGVSLTVLPDIVPNGGINVDDLLAVINGWGSCPVPPALCPADVVPLGGNGTVNVDDLLAVINAWGSCP